MSGDSHMIQIPRDCPAFRDGGDNGHLAAAVDAFRDIDLKYSRQHLGPRMILHELGVALVLDELKALLDMRLQREFLAVRGIRGEYPSPSNEMGPRCSI